MSHNQISLFTHGPLVMAYFSNGGKFFPGQQWRSRFAHLFLKTSPRWNLVEMIIRLSVTLIFHAVSSSWSSCESYSTNLTSECIVIIEIESRFNMTLLFSRFLFEIFPEFWRTVRDHGRIHPVAQMGYLCITFLFIHTEVDDAGSAAG